VKLHGNACDAASTTLQTTVVVPIGNAVPEAGEQLTDSGWTPPVACGSGNTTRTERPVNDCVSTGAGQSTVGRGEAVRSSGAAGEDVFCAQPTVNAASTPNKIHLNAVLMGAGRDEVTMRKGAG
jgi:hypothetical protein